LYRLLEGYRIVEAAAFVAGPSCGLHLAQMGAEVIRIDMIGGGPDYRRWPLAPSGDSLYWEGLNKAKKSVAIDLRNPKGRELALALATAPGEMAGLFVTNYPHDSFFSHEALAERRKDIISARIMGWADGAPAVDYTVNAAVGVPEMTGHPDDPRPVNHVLPAWDLLGGAYAAFAICAATMRRQRTGEGAELRIALSDLASTSLGHLGNVADVMLGGDRQPMGNTLFGAFGRDFLCADAVRLMVVAITRNQWSALIEALEITASIAELAERLSVDFAADEGARFTHRELLFPIFEHAFAKSDSATWAERFDSARVTWSRYRTLADAVANDPRIVSGNPQFQNAEHPSGLDYPAAGPPAVIGEEARAALAPAPRLGGHSDEVMAQVLGMSDGEIASLHDQGIIA